MTVPIVPSLVAAPEAGAAPTGSRGADASKTSANATPAMPLFAAALANFLPVALVTPQAGGVGSSDSTGMGVPPAARAAVATASQGFVPLTSLLDAKPLQGVATGGVQVESASTSLLDAAVPGAGATAVPSTAAVVERSLAALQPVFRTKLQAVIARMNSEYGYQVGVNETYRPQARQDQLFAQGRTAPGAIVTWTDHSLHTQGLAADLTISGAADPTLANQRLAIVAQEEGLRTLGPRDPDHVELSGPTAPSLHGMSTRVIAAPANAGLMSAPEPPAPRAAAIARVAPVAQVATVARVATVAPPAAPDRPAAFVPTAAPAPSMAPMSSAGTSAHDRPSSQDAGSRNDPHGGRGDRNAAAAADVAPTPANPASVMTGPGAPAAGPATLRGDVAQERTSIGAQIARFDAVHQAAATQPMSQVVLRLDGADGGSDRIRVGVRGSAVQATVGTADSGLSQRLATDLGQLRTVLQGHGLEVGSLRVHADASTLHFDVAPERAIASLDRGAGGSSLGNSSGGDTARGSDHPGDGSPSHQSRRQPGNPNRRQQQKPQGEFAS